MPDVDFDLLVNSWSYSVKSLFWCLRSKLNIFIIFVFKDAISFYFSFNKSDGLVGLLIIVDSISLSFVGLLNRMELSRLNLKESKECSSDTSPSYLSLKFGLWNNSLAFSSLVFECWSAKNRIYAGDCFYYYK